MPSPAKLKRLQARIVAGLQEKIHAKTRPFWATVADEDLCAYLTVLYWLVGEDPMPRPSPDEFDRAFRLRESFPADAVEEAQRLKVAREDRTFAQALEFYLQGQAIIKRSEGRP